MDPTLLTPPALPVLDLPVAVVWPVAAVLGLLVGLAGAAVVAGRARRRTAEELRASRAELRRLHDRVEQLSTALTSGSQTGPTRHAREHLITSLPGTQTGTPAHTPASTSAPTPTRAATATTRAAPAGPSSPPVDAGRFLSVAAGESLVRLLSLGYGVRRALSPRSRDRIRLEVREEVRRARRRRHDELREARRHLRSRRPDMREDAA